MRVSGKIDNVADPRGGGVDGAPGGTEGWKRALVVVEDAPSAVDEEGDIWREWEEDGKGLLGDEVEEGGKDGGGAEVAPVDGLVFMVECVVGGRHECDVNDLNAMRKYGNGRSLGECVGAMIAGPGAGSVGAGPGVRRSLMRPVEDGMLVVFGGVGARLRVPRILVFTEPLYDG
jgi:hypothetical protein